MGFKEPCSFSAALERIKKGERMFCHGWLNHAYVEVETKGEGLHRTRLVRKTEFATNGYTPNQEDMFTDDWACRET